MAAVAAGGPPGKEQLSGVLGGITRTMITDFHIQAILDHLVERIVDVLPITAAGVMLISPGLPPHYLAASDKSALRFEGLQTELGEGPCRAACDSGLAVLVPDLRTEDRFPLFATRAVREGLAAVFAFPLRSGKERLGALDLYRDTPGPLNAAAMVAAQTLADVAAGYLLNAQARADLRDSSDRYRESSLRDALTGLPNRVLLVERLDHAMLRGRRSGRTAAVLFIDLDRFKEVNDRHGPRFGDELLAAVAARLSAGLRPGDTLARLYGDEFVILCEDLGDPLQGEAIAARVHSSLAAPFSVSGQSIEVTASVGIAYSGPSDHLPEQLLQDADTAMYDAKRKGGARHQIVDLREQHLAETRSGVEHDLRGAAGRGELRADYQPIVVALDGTLVAVEALVRWARPHRGLVSPTTLVPLAEQAGFISEIGQWVLVTACADRQRWATTQPGLVVALSVNVSAHQLTAPDFAGSVASVLAAGSTPPALVTLEMTESVLIHDSKRALTVLHDLKDLGVTLALDDFGTGYSSLLYLKRFPIDTVKIDQAFVADLGRDPASHAIVSATIDMAHALHMTVVAEGIETVGQHHILTAAGCDLCQGFYFAPPMTADDLATLLGDAIPDDGLATLLIDGPAIPGGHPDAPIPGGANPGPAIPDHGNVAVPAGSRLRLPKPAA